MKGAFGVSLDTLFAYLTGIGCALLFFLFISGGATRISFMGGIGMMFVFAKAALHNGFLQKIISSITSKGKTKAGAGVLGFIRGMASGSALGAFIGLIGINLIFIIIGCLLIASGTVMMILQVKGVIKLGKEENTK